MVVVPSGILAKKQSQTMSLKSGSACNSILLYTSGVYCGQRLWPCLKSTETRQYLAKKKENVFLFSALRGASKKYNFSYFMSYTRGSLQKGTPQFLRRTKYLKMRNGGWRNFLSRQIMMMCYQLQEKVGVEDRREGETPESIGGLGL